MERTIETRDACTLVELKGRLDALSSPPLQAELLTLAEQDAARLLIDLSDMDYISSAGLRVLLTLAKTIEARGGRLVLCGMHDYVHEIFEMAGFLDIFTIRPGQDEAIHAMQEEFALLKPGDVLQGRFVIESVLGEGGMGAVYLARLQLLGNARVAIKEIREEFVSEQSQALFQKEAQMLAGLKHPGLVSFKDYFLEGGHQYMVMDYIRGNTLMELIREAGGPIETRRVLDWTLQMAQALEYLHSQHPPIILRDLKPHNVMVTSENKVTIIDFGIARIFDDGGTTTTQLKGSGTFGYAPMEQYTSSTDPRSDLYSLGATLYHLLTGRRPPFALDLVDTPLEAPHRINPDLSPEVDKVVLKMMAVEPTERYQTATEVCTALRDLQAPSLPAPAAAEPGGATSATTALVLSPVAGRLLRIGKQLAVPVGLVLLLVAVAMVPHRSEAPGEHPVRPSPAASVQTVARQDHPEKQIQNEVDGSTLIYIPAGPFIMGSDTLADTRPPHIIDLPAFYMARTEVTVGQFRKFLAQGFKTKGRFSGIASDARDDEPIWGITFLEAQQYCEWAHLQLPTEAEWEKAARGTDGRNYPWGNDWDASRCRNGTDGSNGPSDVGSYPAGVSPYGCLDMAGNLAEWTDSWYEAYPDNTQPSPGYGHRARVVRGGSWESENATGLLSFFRDPCNPKLSSPHIGFRGARPAEH